MFFVQGSGDVLISYENEAIANERAGKPVQHVTPLQTFKTKTTAGGQHTPWSGDQPETSSTLQAQKLRAQAGFRPVDLAVAADLPTRFRAGGRTIADLGGWAAWIRC